MEKQQTTKTEPEKNGMASLNMDVLESLIIEGLSYRAIAERLNVHLHILHDFLSKEEHFARAQTALNTSAQTFDDKAEQVLIDAERDSIEIQRAKELSQYYRWKAAKRNPRKYSDKLDLSTNGKDISIAPPTLVFMKFDNQDE